VAELAEPCDVRFFGRKRGEHAPEHGADFGIEHAAVVVVLGHPVIVVIVHLVGVAVAVIVMVARHDAGRRLQRLDLLFQSPDAGLVLLPQRRDLDGKDGSHRRIGVRLGLCRRRGERHRNRRSGGSRRKSCGVAHVTAPSLVASGARRPEDRYEIILLYMIT